MSLATAIHNLKWVINTDIIIICNIISIKTYTDITNLTLISILNIYLFSVYHVYRENKTALGVNVPRFILYYLVYRVSQINSHSLNPLSARHDYNHDNRFNFLLKLDHSYWE